MSTMRTFIQPVMTIAKSWSGIQVQLTSNNHINVLTTVKKHIMFNQTK